MESPGIREQLLSVWQGMVDSTFAAVPKVVAGLLLLVFAILVAKVVERVLRAALRRVGLDAAISRFGLDQSLRRFGIESEASALVPRIAYYLLLFLFAQTAALALKLDPISNAIGSFLAFLPNLVSALLLLLIGSTAGSAAGGAVTRAARESGIDYSSALGNVVTSLVVFIAGIMALAQLRIDTDIIRIVTICTLAAVALAFGLSFGLGTRDVTRNVVAGFYARKIFREGDEVEVRGVRGVLKAITPLQTLVEGKEGTITVANGVFLDETIRQ